MALRIFSGLWLSVVLLAAGCGPDKVADPTPTTDPGEARCVQLFGARAEVTGIAWRSSGLGVRIVVPGEGTPPRMNDTVRVHYTARLKDGTVIDDSRARGKPEDFVVSRLIAGWAAAMGAMRPGGRAELFIPPSLGYGGRKVAGVPPNSGLLFEVELLAVNPPPAPP